MLNHLLALPALAHAGLVFGRHLLHRDVDEPEIDLQIRLSEMPSIGHFRSRRPVYADPQRAAREVLEIALCIYRERKPVAAFPVLA